MMIKKIIPVAVIAVLMSFFSYSIADDTDLNQESNMAAAFSAARTVIDEMKSKEIPGLVEETRDNILAYPKKHSDLVRSEKIIKKFHKAKFDTVLEISLRTIHENFNVTLDKQKFLKLVWKENKKMIVANRGIFLNTKGREIFKMGRSLAVRTQVNKIAMNAYPDIKVIEDLYEVGWKTNLLNEKKAFLQERMSQEAQKIEEALLPEVANELDKKNDEIFAHSKVQIETQFKELKKEPAKRLITLEQLIKSMTKKVKDRIKKMDLEKKPGQFIYKELFSSVSSRITKIAETEELDRFRSFIKSTSLKVADSNAISKIINADLSSHKTYIDSLDTIAERYIKDTEEKFIDKYVSLAPNDEQEMFRERLTKRHLSAVKNDIPLMAKKLIESDLKEARHRIASNQLKNHFPQLADKSLALTGKNEIIIKRITWDRNLSVDSFGAVMKQPVRRAITSNPIDTDKLLDETETAVMGGVGFIVGEAERAWKGQEKIYLSHKGYVWDAAAKRKTYVYTKVKQKMAGEDSLSELDKKSLVNYFIQKIEGVWRANRIRIIWPQTKPIYIDTKYVELFDYIKKELEKTLDTNIDMAVNNVKRRAEKTRQQKIEEEEKARRRTEKVKQRKAKEEGISVKNDLLQAIDGILARMEMGNITFNAPDSMNLNDNALIHLILSMEKTIDDIKRMIEKEGEKTGTSIRVHPQIKATLSGLNFETKTITPEVQAIAANETTEWRWEIKSKMEGPQLLHLALSSLIDIEGESTPRTIRTIDKTIEVQVTWAQETKAHSQNYKQWLWVIIFIPIAVWFWKTRVQL